MDNKYKVLLENLVENTFEAAIEDQDFNEEILKEYNVDYQTIIENGEQKINELIGELKIELGQQRHHKTLLFIEKIKKLGEEKFNKLIEKLQPDNKQVALEFYRKINEPDSSDTLNKDKTLIKLMNQFDDINEIEDLL